MLVPRSAFKRRFQHGDGRCVQACWKFASVAGVRSSETCTLKVGQLQGIRTASSNRPHMDSFYTETRKATQQKEGMRSVLKDYTGAITRLGRQQLWWHALALLDDMYNLHGLEPDLRAYTAVVNACCKGWRLEQSLQLLDLAHARSLELNEYAYSSVIGACGRIGNWVQALELLTRMSTRDIRANVVVCNAAISACGKSSQWQCALGLLASAGNMCLVPDVVSYNAAVSACDKGHQWCHALGLLDEAYHLQLQLTVVTFNATISACGNGDEWQRALALLVNMQQGNSTCAPNTISYSTAMTSCVRNEQWAIALLLFDDMSKFRVELNEVAGNVAICAHSKAQDWQMAVRLLQRLQVEVCAGSSLDVMSYTSVISALKSGACWETAMQIFEGMQQVDVSPNVVAFSALMGVLEHGRQWQRCIELFWEMCQGKVTPNEITYVLVISACAKGQHWTSALGLLDFMHQQEDRPSLAAWKAGIRQQPWDVSLRLLARMYSHYVEPDTPTYNMAIHACQKSQQWESVLLILQDMLRNKLDPDASTIDLLSTIPDLQHNASHVLEQLFRHLGLASDVASHETAEHRLESPSVSVEAAAPPGPPPSFQSKPSPQFGVLSTETSSNTTSQSKSLDPVLDQRSSHAEESDTPGKHEKQRTPPPPPPLPAMLDLSPQASPDSHVSSHGKPPTESPPEEASHEVGNLNAENTTDSTQEVLEDGDPHDGASADRPLSYRRLPGGDALVDLHGLPVEVAKIAVQVALEDLIIGPVHTSPTSGKGNFVIVTGRGKHSPGGEALVRPAVISLLRDDFGLQVIYPSAGRLKISASELWRLRGVPSPAGG